MWIWPLRKTLRPQIVIANSNHDSWSILMQNQIKSPCLNSWRKWMGWDFWFPPWFPTKFAPLCEPCSNKLNSLLSGLWAGWIKTGLGSNRLWWLKFCCCCLVYSCFTGCEWLLSSNTLISSTLLTGWEWAACFSLYWECSLETFHYTLVALMIMRSL